jgi:hypothetical protein
VHHCRESRQLQSQGTEQRAQRYAAEALRSIQKLAGVALRQAGDPIEASIEVPKLDDAQA